MGSADAAALLPQFVAQPSDSTDPKPSERILLVRLSHLGDVCHALPVYHALRRRHPDAQLAWIVQPEFAGLIADLPQLARVIPFDRQGGIGAWLRARRAMRAFAPDWTIDAQGNLKSATATWLSGAPRRTGLHPQNWREPFGARILNEFAPPPYGRHAIHRMQCLVECIDPGGADPDTSLPLSEATRRAGEQALNRRLPDRGRPRRILHLGCPGDPRSWPTDSVATLLEALSRAGEDVLLLAGPAERQAAQQLASRLTDLEGLRCWTDGDDLSDLAGLLAAAAEANIRLVAGDTGPCHVAAAVGVGVDLIVGSSDPERTGPWPPADERGSPHRLHRPPQGNPIQGVNPLHVAGRLIEEST